MPSLKIKKRNLNSYPFLPVPTPSYSKEEGEKKKFKNLDIQNRVEKKNWQGRIFTGF